MLLALCASPNSVSADTANGIRLSEPVRQTAAFEEFGAMLVDGSDPVPLATLLIDSERHLDREVRITANIASVCQRKGCFFIARDGAAVARVTFEDYSFFIPTDSAGRDVTLQGVLKREEVSVDRARHYAQDAGEDESAITAPVFEYHIVANAVRLQRRG